MPCLFKLYFCLLLVQTSSLHVDIQSSPIFSSSKGEWQCVSKPRKLLFVLYVVTSIIIASQVYLYTCHTSPLFSELMTLHGMSHSQLLGVNDF